jgi:hypothetical protein
VSSDKSAETSALAVMQAHLHALNALDEDGLAATLHFPIIGLLASR